MHNRYDTGRIVDLTTEIAELKDKLKKEIDSCQFYQKMGKVLADKLSRRNTLITDLRGQVNKLKKEIEDYESNYIDTLDD